MTADAVHLDLLPHPTGRYRVGRTSIEIVDDRRRDVYAPDAATRRALVLWIWYPAAADADGDHAALLPARWAPIAEYLGIQVDGVRTAAIDGAPVSDQHPSYPVLLLSPSGFSPLLLSAIAEELTSTGYVVVGVNHTYETAVTAFADGRTEAMNPGALGGALGPQTGSPEAAFRRRAAVCDYKAADLRSVADHLRDVPANTAGLTADHLDLARLGAFGHSFGGNAALEWCRIDERCRAAANLDGALWTRVAAVGLPRPALQILADHPEFELSGAAAVERGIATDPVWHDAERALSCDGWRNLHRLANPGYTARITGATHLSFMDVPFLPRRGDSPVTSMLAATPIDPRRAWRITSDLLLGFFDHHLRGAPRSFLPAAHADHPEVQLGPP